MSAETGWKPILLPLRHDHNMCRHRYDEFVSPFVSANPFFDHCANRAEFMWRLACQQSSGANSRIALRFEKIGRSWKMPLDRARLIDHRVAIKSGSRQYILAFLLLAVRIMWRTLGQLHIQVRVCLNRVINDFGAGIPPLAQPRQ